MRRPSAAPEADVERAAAAMVGKGGGGDDPYAERGVLRRSVPHWLRLPELRPLVVGLGKSDAPTGPTKG
jgi:DNA-nicking Smr family endonuclease